MIVPKASKSEKNEGLDNFDTKQLPWEVVVELEIILMM